MLPLLLNKKARFDFEIQDSVVAGVVLTGGEVKMLRGKHGSLQGSHVRIVNGEAWLLNAQIPPYPYARNENYDPKRSRKLLLKKNELLALEAVQQTKGRALVPTIIGLSGRHIKVEVGIARGKTAKDRRETIKKRDLERETGRKFK
jgi:SsrA-binding protein